jgi:S1-C subfamily serine protease
MNATSGALGALSSELASTVAATARSVVYVDAHPRRDASGIVWDEHHVVTVAHAIDREDDIALLLGGGSSARARLVGIDRATDIAVVRTESSLPALARGTDRTLAVGNLVLAIARDEDDATGASFGIVSSLDGPWQTWRGGKIERFIRPDLSVYPAFSGGPLVDTQGAAIGMNTWGLTRRSAVTLPIETLARVAGEILAHGRVSRGYLGVAMQAVRLPDALRATLGIAQHAGAIVVDVAAGGPAEAGGIFIGDVLLSIAGSVVEDSDDVQRALSTTSAGDACALKVLRAGRVHDLTLALGERPHDGR